MYVPSPPFPPFIITGISGHASVMTVFTSNYDLAGTSQRALQQLDMFKNILPLTVTAVADEERVDFANGLLSQLLHDATTSSTTTPQHQFVSEITGLSSLGKGDIRTLVRHLRTIAFFLSASLNSSASTSSTTIKVRVRQDQGGHVVVGTDGDGTSGSSHTIELRVGSHGNLYPVDGRLVDPRTAKVMERFHHHYKGTTTTTTSTALKDDLPHIVDYYLCGILAPGVVVASSSDLSSSLLLGLGGVVEGMKVIEEVDAGRYKIVKSLYDGPEVACLRDDIKSHRRVHKNTMVTTSILATTTDAQLRIREILEDTPSMIAFSTYRSALHKKGLFFIVRIPSDCPTTPELSSRASIIIS